MKTLVTTLTLLLAAPSVFATSLSGTVHKDEQGEYVDFDLRLGGDSLQYKIKGNTSPDKGIYHTVTDISGVKVSKVGVDSGGRTRFEEFPNDGTLNVYYKARELEKVRLAGLSVEGGFFKGYFIPNRKFPQLVVDGRASRGELSYNIFNGHYDAKRGLTFGNVRIGSSAPGGKTVFNFDNLPLGYNKTAVSMHFGDFVVKGQINYTDITRSVSTGDGDSIDVPIASTGRYNLKVTRADGSEPRFAAPGERETKDDETARHLLALFELMTF